MAKSQATGEKAPDVKETKEVKSQSELLRLDRFDYKNLVGDSFNEYEEMVKTLTLQDQYDFEVFSASPIKKERYPGLPQTPIDIVGVKINLDMPMHQTRIETRHAIELNKQLANSGRYYLLKK